jgi:hypothetical protein
MTRLLLPVDAPPVAVVRAGRQFLLAAVRAIAPGQVLFDIAGEEHPVPNQWSVQVGPVTHIAVPAGADLTSQLDRYPWRFMNHHCDPNTRVDARLVIAVRAIAPGDEVTFNYNSTEWDMAVPFACHCGIARCGGLIAGYRHLSDAEREQLRSIASAHLCARAAR